ncbi:taste receptor type 2 member 9-like [Mixophyes fleayi]|uniref:taste receptor type 2 member 9-like n=1 Tax=Mixophyes fleayi TaxID=3061075 RepID=UPI003F4E3592
MLCRREVEKLEHWISSSVLAVVNIIGLHVNGFIVAVNLMDMRTGRTLKPIDRILLSLGLCRLCLQTLLIIETLKCFALLSDIPLDTHNFVSSAIYKSLEYCSFWFTAWLCLLYGVKIVNCKIRMFLALKMRIPQMILPAILGSLIIAVISGCLFACRFKVTYGNPLSRNISSDLEFDVVFHPFVFGHFLPFSIIAISSLFLLYTLINHVRRLKQSSSSFTFNRMDFYLSSIRYLILLFLVSALKLTSAISLVTPTRRYGLGFKESARHSSSVISKVVDEIE